MVTLSKKIIVKDNSTVQKGRYVQEECTFYGVHHPSITGELIDGANFLYQGCMTRIYLDNMYRKTIEFTGSIPPLYWYYVESQKMLLLQLPLGSGGIPFTFKEPPQLEDIVVAEPEGSGRGGNPGEYWVYISKGDCTPSLYQGKELVKNYSVAVGRNLIEIGRASCRERV